MKKLIVENQPEIVSAAGQIQTVNQQTKSIAVVNINSGAITEIEISPGTTAHEVRQGLDLPQSYQFSPGPGEEPLPEHINMYDEVPNGAKLYAGTEVNVGEGVRP